MAFATKLQSFQGSNTYQNSIASNCLPVWSGGFCYITGGQAGWTTMAKVNVVGGTEAAFSDLSLLNDPTLNVSVGTGFPWGLDQDEQLYCRSGLGMSRIDPSDWTRHDTWGALTYGIFPPPLPDCTGSNNALGGHIVAIKNADGTKYWISGGVGGFGFFGNDVYLQSGDKFAGLHFSGYDPGNTSGCNGPNSQGFGYVTTHSNSTNDPALIFKILCTDGTWVPADWPTPNPNITKTTIASINPTDIDAAWGNIRVAGICLDQTDSNIIVVFNGDVGTNLRYLTKIDSGTGAILWSIAVDNNFNPGSHMRFSNIQGRYYFVVAGHIYGYNTTDGGLIIDQTTGLEDLLVPGSQMFDDITGVIIGNFNQQALGPDSPTILNTTPAFVTNTIAWMALYVAEPPPSPRARRFLAESRPIRIIQ